MADWANHKLTDQAILEDPPDYYVWAGWPSRKMAVRWSDQTTWVHGDSDREMVELSRALRAAGAERRTEMPQQ